MSAPRVRRGGGLPFVQLVSPWMCDDRCSTNLRTLYGILATYADVDSRDTEKGRPWRQALAEQLGCSEKTLDRTVFEGECAGWWWVEKRTDPNNPKLNDANIYHLRDREFWAGTWVDPLKPGQKAADVAKALIESRAAEKRAAGILPKGGRKKAPAKGGGVMGDATPGPVDNPGGGVTGDARGGVMGDGRVASPVTPNIQSPIKTTTDETAPFGRDSVPDARRASTGSSVRAPRGGSAAASKTKPATNQRTAEAIRTVVAALPDELRTLETRPLPDRIPAKPLGDLIRDQLANHRTPEQLVARIKRRWVEHGWAEKCHSTMDGESLRSGVAIAVELVKAGECPDLGCEDGTILDTRGECRTCEKRRSDRRSKAGVPAQPATVSTDRWHCAGRDGQCRAVAYGTPPTDQLCRDCRAEVDEIRAAFSAVGFDTAQLAEAPY